MCLLKHVIALCVSKVYLTQMCVNYVKAHLFMFRVANSRKQAQKRPASPGVGQPRKRRAAGKTLLESTKGALPTGTILHVSELPITASSQIAQKVSGNVIFETYRGNPRPCMLFN